MTITIPKEILKEFFKLSSTVSVTERTLLEINKMIKIKLDFGKIQITKTNYEKFIIFNFDLPQSLSAQDDCEFIIVESEVLSFTNTCKKENITIRIDETTTYFNDSYEIGNTQYKLEDFHNIKIGIDMSFPIIFSGEIIKNLLISSVFIGKDNLMPHLTNAYIEKKYIYSCNRSEAYICNLEGFENFPFISLSQKEIEIIKDFPQCRYKRIENYNVFQFSSYIYGTIINENSIGFFNSIESSFVPSSGYPDFKEGYIKLKIQLFIDFCESTIVFSKNESDKIRDPKAFFKFDSFLGIIDLLFHDTDYNKKNKASFGVFGNFSKDFEFKFNVFSLLPVLKVLNLKYTEICISNSGASAFTLFSESDKTFFCYIQKIS